MATETIKKCDICGKQHSNLVQRYWADCIGKLEINFKDHIDLQSIPFTGDCCTACGHELEDIIINFIKTKKEKAFTDKLAKDN